MEIKGPIPRYKVVVYFRDEVEQVRFFNDFDDAEAFEAKVCEHPLVSVDLFHITYELDGQEANKSKPRPSTDTIVCRNGMV